MPDRAVAILTGDFVNSSKVVPQILDKAMEQVAQSAKDMADWVRNKDLRFTRFRGDGWQVCIDDHWLSLRAALVLMARLRAGGTGLTSRISIGIGPIDTQGTLSLSDAHGAAFETSGRGLDHMKSIDRIGLGGSSIDAKDQIIAELLTERAGRWTAAQAEAMVFYLHPNNPSLEQIGTELGISAQAVGYRLTGAGAYNIRRAVGKWESFFEFAQPKAIP